MRIEATRTFARLYRGLPSEVQEQVKKVLALLEANPQHPSLGHKKMAGHADIFELRVALSYRITYQRIGNMAVLRKVGTHDLLRRP